MIAFTSRKLFRKFLILGILLGCLGFVSNGVGTGVGTNAARDASFLPCCSVCEPDPTIPICRHGCSPSC